MLAKGMNEKRKRKKGKEKTQCWIGATSTKRKEMYLGLVRTKKEPSLCQKEVGGKRERGGGEKTDDLQVKGRSQSSSFV